MLLLACWPTPAPAPQVHLITATAQQAILANPGERVAGPPDANVTIIEWMDYNCPYCKKYTGHCGRAAAAAGHRRPGRLEAVNRGRAPSAVSAAAALPVAALPQRFDLPVQVRQPLQCSRIPKRQLA
jgi:hypothetical protein